MTDERREPRLDPPPGVGGDLVEQLRATLERAGELVHILEVNLRRPGATDAPLASGDQVVALEGRLVKAEADARELAAQLVESEHQAGRLMNLYVATYQLHASLDPEEVKATIAEIAVNLLGAERFVLILRRETSEGYEIALRQGAMPAAFADDAYQGGDPVVDATLADGVLRLGPESASTTVAAVPLRVQGEVVGAVVLLQLLPQKPALRPEDRELLDLLSAHAASALFAARLFALKERRLRTLESLVKLARGE
jgi:GAF domain-containing protein